eukprot:COSAG03_NODE_1251_length_4472_cov_70.829636_3_plen_77_part_00
MPLNHVVSLLQQALFVTPLVGTLARLAAGNIVQSCTRDMLDLQYRVAVCFPASRGNEPTNPCLPSFRSVIQVLGIL